MVPHHLRILLVSAVLATASGCQVLGIPSYRADSGQLAGHQSPQMVCVGDSCSEVMVGEGEEMLGAPRVLPPLPGWLGRWHAKKNIPEAPDHPRFHPLPTRPMFSPAPAGVEPVAGYGGLPATESW
jgi:hypothetical protein